MGSRKCRPADRALRPPMRSPGRPPVARREHRQRFWEAIARGVSSDQNSLEKQVPWLQLTEDARKLCRRSDDAFDALIAALVARAAALGFTDAPPPEISAAAETEGWIHLPAAHSLRDLAGHRDDCGRVTWRMPRRRAARKVRLCNLTRVEISERGPVSLRDGCRTTFRVRRSGGGACMRYSSKHRPRLFRVGEDTAQLFIEGALARDRDGSLAPFRSHTRATRSEPTRRADATHPRA